LTQIIIVYESKFGNTRLVAEKLAEGIREVEGMEVVVTELKDVGLYTIQVFDAVLIGSPNHFHGPTRSIKKFIDGLGKLDLEGKWYAVFDTYIEEDFRTAVKKMEARINQKVPGVRQIAYGLSIKVQDVKGPVLVEELPKCKDFGNKIAKALKSVS